MIVNVKLLEGPDYIKLQKAVQNIGTVLYGFSFT